jgi:hypothetical protein
MECGSKMQVTEATLLPVWTVSEKVCPHPSQPSLTRFRLLILHALQLLIIDAFVQTVQYHTLVVLESCVHCIRGNYSNH